MLPEVEYTASQHVSDAVTALGRTEDVRFSPSNTRLAVAGFYRNRIAVFDIELVLCSGAPQIALTGGVELSSPALQRPHGLDFIDEDTLIVTSRGGDVAVFKVPPGEKTVPTHTVVPIARWPGNIGNHLNAPGSVAVTRVEQNECEVLICNNNGHTVTRHLLDRGGKLTSSEILLHRHLSIPDGVSVSSDRRWIAVSNHNTHNVLLYRYSSALNADTEPDGILRGVHCPHGVRFSADGRHLFVADAGAPYLHTFAQGLDEWGGVRPPLGSLRIMNDAVFARGRHNPEEGGPKGLDLAAGSRILVLTSECQLLAFFDVSTVLQYASAQDAVREQSRLRVRHELDVMEEAAEMREQRREVKALQNSLTDLRNTISWRITAPLRRLKAILGAPK